MSDKLKLVVVLSIEVSLRDSTTLKFVGHSLTIVSQLPELFLEVVKTAIDQFWLADLFAFGRAVKSVPGPVATG